jgi:hypothetical protein
MIYDAKLIFAEKNTPLPEGNDGMMVCIKANGDVLYRKNGVWKNTRVAQANPMEVRVRIPKGWNTEIKFPVACKSKNPTLMLTGRSVDDWNTIIGVKVTELTRYGFKALSMDEDCILEFSYGDPKTL